MKFRSTETRIKRPRSDQLAVEVDTQRPVREGFSFLQPGDKDILFQNLERRRNDDESYFALAAFRLLFPELPLPRRFQLKEVALQLAVRENIQNVHLNTSVADSTPNQAYNVLGEYFKALMIRSKDDDRHLPIIISENYHGWLQHVEDFFDPFFGTVHAAYLCSADPEQFEKELTPGLRDKLLSAPGEIRKDRSLESDPKQRTLLEVLAHVRMMFPDQVGPHSLTEGEQEALKQYLEELRTRSSKGTEGFSQVLFYLAVLESPKLIVDEKGIHLAHGEQVSQSAPLPNRSVL